MIGFIIYIRFSGDYYKFDEWKYKTKDTVRYNRIIKFLTKK